MAVAAAAPIAVLPVGAMVAAAESSEFRTIEWQGKDLVSSKFADPSFFSAGDLLFCTFFRESNRM